MMDIPDLINEENYHEICTTLLEAVAGAPEGYDESEFAERSSFERLCIIGILRRLEVEPTNEKAELYMREIMGYIDRLREMPSDTDEAVEKLGDEIEAVARDIILVVLQDTYPKGDTT